MACGAGSSGELTGLSEGGKTGAEKQKIREDSLCVEEKGEQ